MESPSITLIFAGLAGLAVCFGLAARTLNRAKAREARFRWFGIEEGANEGVSPSGRTYFGWLEEDGDGFKLILRTPEKMTPGLIDIGAGRGRRSTRTGTLLEHSVDLETGRPAELSAACTHPEEVRRLVNKPDVFAGVRVFFADLGTATIELDEGKITAFWPKFPPEGSRTIRDFMNRALSAMDQIADGLPDRDAAVSSDRTTGNGHQVGFLVLMVLAIASIVLTELLFEHESFWEPVFKVLFLPCFVAFLSYYLAIHVHRFSLWGYSRLRPDERNPPGPIRWLIGIACAAFFAPFMVGVLSFPIACANRLIGSPELLAEAPKIVSREKIADSENPNKFSYVVTLELPGGRTVRHGISPEEFGTSTEGRPFDVKVLRGALGLTYFTR